MKSKLLAILGLAFFVSSCVEGEKNTQATIRQVKSESVSLVDENINSSTFPGKVYAASDVNLSFRIPGIIENVVVKEGDLVRKGDVVAFMDKRDYQIQLSATQAEYDGIKSEVDRIVALHKEQSVSDNDYDKAVNGLRQITAKLEAHKNAVNDTELKAPFDGYVQSINFDKGEAVAAGMPVLAFISCSAPEIIINIPASEYIKRKSLTSAWATIDIFPGQIFKLSRIGTTYKANLNQLYATRFSVEASAEGVVPSAGMTAMVRLNYDDTDAEDVEISFSAVFESEGKTYVWVIENGEAIKREVSLGAVKKDGKVVVTEGLAVGEQVITAGIRSLSEGQRVEPIEARSESNVGNIL